MEECKCNGQCVVYCPARLKKIGVVKLQADNDNIIWLQLKSNGCDTVVTREIKGS